MKDIPESGIISEFKFIVSKSKTVSALYPESDEFQQMPKVFATGFLVGFLEWACIKMLNPYLDWPAEQTVGTYFDLNHTAATPPGFEVTAKVKLVDIQGRRLVFEVEAYDDIDLIAKGKHERVIINKEKFDSRIQEKIAKKCV